jgi:hypothetical protein
MELKMILERLEGIAAEVSDINQSGKLLKMNLLGGYEGETQHGRIPKLEVQIENHAGRIESLENAHIKYKAYGAAVAVASGFVSSILTSAIYFLIRYALRGGTH